MKLTPELEEKILDAAMQGLPVEKIRAILGVSTTEFYRQVNSNPEFLAKYARARSDGMEEIADKLITMHEEIPDVQKARLASDNFKWLLSKRKSQTYGDRIDLNVNQTIDIKGALDVAKARAMLPPRYPPNVIDVQVIDDTKQIECSEPAVPAEAPIKLPKDTAK